MALIEDDIRGLRQLQNDLREGKIAPDVLKMHLAIYSQIDKRTKSYLAAIGMTAKYGSKVKKHLLDANLMDGSSVKILSQSEIETEKIVCPIQNKVLISRAECLDLSGESSNYAECSGCPNFKITRKLLA